VGKPYSPPKDKTYSIMILYLHYCREKREERKTKPRGFMLGIRIQWRHHENGIGGFRREAWVVFEILRVA